MQARKKADTTLATVATGAPTGGEEEAHALANPKHEAFAQAISLGEDPTAACQRLFRCRPATAQTKSAALLAASNITARIATLRQQASHIATHHAHFSKADLIAFLVETIQTPVSSVDPHHRQCQEWTRDELTTGGRRTNPASQQKTQTSSSKASAKSKATSSAKEEPPGTDAGKGAGESAIETAPPILLRSKTKIPSKLDAAKLLATLCGWNAPSKLEGSVNLGISPTVEEALSRLLK